VGSVKDYFVLEGQETAKRYGYMHFRLDARQ